jgi:hypothetical protein
MRAKPTDRVLGNMRAPVNPYSTKRHSRSGGGRPIIRALLSLIAIVTLLLSPMLIGGSAAMASNPCHATVQAGLAHCPGPASRMHHGKTMPTDCMGMSCVSAVVVPNTSFTSRVSHENMLTAEAVDFQRRFLGEIDTPPPRD